MSVVRAVSIYHRLVPAGGWLFFARAILTSAREARRAGLMTPRRALAWCRAAGRVYRIGFAVWRTNGGKWRGLGGSAAAPAADATRAIRRPTAWGLVIGGVCTLIVLRFLRADLV
ncbi:hypothetical protein D9601_17250 [Sphingomonas sp. MA1305]|jgi:hypothetical protein|uniref:hypothetical protein n=1 Tax=Sphingomonas sp. MA1305 TaxID=2479204 RepID=UPI0018DF33AC|nr:hypothetical protein [Sphingomonas sp. MA1305]MBI0477097.1 hypothetical protein [Sphingomonas sp. MA1305]